MKRKLTLGLSIYALGFLVLFAGKLLFEVLSSDSSQAVFRNQGFVPSTPQNQMNAREENSYQKKNYASDRRQIAVKEAPSGGMQVDQKYERVASLQTRAREFDGAEKSARSNIQNYQAVVQYEKRSGLAGARSLILTVGVVPSKFDAMVEDLRKIGNLVSFDVDKFDRTSEFKETSAKRRTLEAMRGSLLSLKGRAGSIKEFVDLEKQIFEIESQIQALGVTLGDFSEENELCTVRLALFENKPRQRSLFSQIVDSLSWAAGIYSIATVVLFFAVLGVFLGLLVYDKLAPRIIAFLKRN
ncbi:MAG: DUF4349 domain-containing protein [Spirochaetia bacterium]|nr:DUF4349 domain-containing protein [Spirochaetia bacterium]